QGGMDLAGRSDTTIGTWVAGFIAVAAGIALLIGLLTPIAATVVGVAAMGMWLSILRTISQSLFASKLSAGFVAAVAIAVVCLGPGAFSLDARLFGLRE